MAWCRHDAALIPSTVTATRFTPAMAFDPRQLTQLAAEHGTPLWVYDAAVIRERIAQLRRFDVIRYAQKEMCIRDSRYPGRPGTRSLDL